MKLPLVYNFISRLRPWSHYTSLNFYIGRHQEQASKGLCATSLPVILQQEEFISELEDSHVQNLTKLISVSPFSV